MARTADLLALVRADWRSLGAWLLGGWAIFGLVLSLALVDLGCRGCPPGTVAPFTAMKVLLFCLVYAMAPWVLSVQIGHQGTAVLAGLPLARRDINRFVLLRGLALGVACLPAWGFLLWVLPRFGMAVHPWLVVTTALALVAYQVFGMVTKRFVRLAVVAVFPLVIFPPHTHRWLVGPLTFANTPWAAVLLAVAITAALPRVLARRLALDERRS